MLDKIRLHSEGRLGPDYIPNLGEGFDLRCTLFLQVPYAEITDRVQKGGSDEEILAWCVARGQQPSEEQISVWNEYMRKRGWNDSGSERLKQRLTEGGFAHRTDVQTFFDYIDLDEGRL
jgi:gluconokinase